MAGGVTFLFQSLHYQVVILGDHINLHKYQVGNYIQPLWEEIMPSTNSSGSDGKSFLNTTLRQSFDLILR